ncbi:uncharacterized protein LY89DRAFT_777183 [Mollisia scopiformis]|uniref:Roadblock/LAMTOR2 domain-containing protein n=1 Tax=Mollisia scopiformis TaxID=149040 RepID=A0A194XTR8_MOLSC|nr:uncharacterized protein LY89DRAFT_777183 [Mollisia scopiformis]KUJ23434.1 hypothetical protein LY89DRAFT_777183 [Mollisia scopiformis]
MGSSPSDIVSDTLQRLSAKAGVLATLAIDRKSSSLLSYKGTLNLLFSSTSTLNVSAAAARTTGTSASVTATSPPPTAAAADSGTGSVTDEEKINDFVQMIWRYVNGTEQMIQGMDEEDDLKLLRLRTKKHELVIVPDSKFIFVVVHDVKSS